VKALRRLGRALIAPIKRVIEHREPALAAAAAGGVADIIAHYGLHLTATQQTWVAAGVFLLVGKITRELVIALGNLDVYLEANPAVTVNAAGSGAVTVNATGGAGGGIAAPVVLEPDPDADAEEVDRIIAEEDAKPPARR
jgi:hypothetical protein